MNQNIRMYFNGHESKDELFFTTDGQCFFTKEQASSHGTVLERRQKGSGIVTPVTRADFNTWWAEEAPKLVTAAQQAVANAENDVANAQKAITALVKNATDTQKMKANKVLNDANGLLAKANTELLTALADVAALPNPAARMELTKEPDPVLTPQEKIDAAQKALDDAKKLQSEAVVAKAGLPDDALAKDKRAATMAVDAANLVVDKAQSDLDELTEA